MYGSRYVVSIHAPAWGATHAYQSFPALFRGFNPRTRVGCDLTITPYCLTYIPFQSTHPRGVRLARPTSCPMSRKFQSTHPRGVRLVEDFNDFRIEGVSIHAPAWGATRKPRPRPSQQSRFNPRTRVGCDCSILASRRSIPRFQSTHPRGVRRAAPMLTSCAVGVSIHAPAWGATPAHTVLIIGYEVSIHAPAWGATSLVC